jgi:hypothetical protein
MVSLSSLILGDEWRMSWCMSLGRGTINSLRGILVKGGHEWATKWAGPTSLGWQAWAHFDPLRGLLRGWCFPNLLECSPFCMWALDISFSMVWIELLVPQDSAFSVQVLGVFRLHGLFLGLLGVMFTSLLYLYRASRSSHKVLDELHPEVLLSMLNSCKTANSKTNMHEQTCYIKGVSTNG